MRRLAAHVRLSSAGLLVAVAFVCLSLTPSLLPRTWQVQGVISGLSATVGYGAGVSLAWLWRRIVRDRRRPGPTPVRPAVGRTALVRRVLAVAPPVGTLALFLHQGSMWQRDLYTLMGTRPQGRQSYLGVLLVTALLLAAAIGLARGMRAGSRWLTRLLRRWIPPMAARAASITMVGLLAVGAFNGAVYDGFLPMMSDMSARMNAAMFASPGVSMAATRSGSAESLVRWGSLGRQGRAFVAGGPTVEQLSRFWGTPAKEPVRAYVGLSSAPNAAAAASLAVRELERTGAFSRSVLCVVTTTGTGWIDPYLAGALEYLHNGDTAIVGTQYSYLPSWISLLTERERVELAGRELFNQVHARWSALPPDQRPRLLVFAESLGSFGSEAAFRDLDDIRARTDGVLWAGPTGVNPLRAELVAGRDPGSTEVLPIYQGGQTVRFVSRPEDLWRPAGPWPAPRVVYLQNPSDPVTWWSPSLLLQRPDWLAEPAGHDVLPAMRWYPLVTFLQVTADLSLAERAPSGHGHYFDRAGVAAWAAIAPPPGWSEARTDELTRLLAE